MLYDLKLMTQNGLPVGYAKIDITNDATNILQKQVSLNDFSFTPPVNLEDEQNQDIFIQTKEKIEAFIQPKNYLFSDLVDIASSINVLVEFNGVVLNIGVMGDTTTTTSTSTTTTTTAG